MSASGGVFIEGDRLKNLQIIGFSSSSAAVLLSHYDLRDELDDVSFLPQ